MAEIFVRATPNAGRSEGVGTWIALRGHDAQSFEMQCRIELGVVSETQLTYRASSAIPGGLVHPNWISPMLWDWVRHRYQEDQVGEDSHSTPVLRGDSGGATSDRRTLDNTDLFRGEYERAKLNLQHLIVSLAKFRLRTERGVQGDATWVRVPGDRPLPKVDGRDWKSCLEETQTVRVYLDELGDFTPTEAQLLAEYLVQDFPEFQMGQDHDGYWGCQTCILVRFPTTLHSYSAS